MRALREREGKPVVLIANQRLSPALLRRGGWTLLSEFKGAIVDEEYYLYEYDDGS